MARRVRGNATRLPIHLISALTQEFTDRLVAIVDEAVRAQVADTIDAYRASIYGGATRHAARKQGPSPLKGSRYVCRVPGCGSSASPRYDLFCVEHRDLPPEEKAAIKARAQPSLIEPSIPDAVAPEQDDAEQGTDSSSPDLPVDALENVDLVQEAPEPSPEEQDATSLGTSLDIQPEPSKPTCSVPECSGGWFRPSGNRRLCRNHWQESRTADATSAQPADSNVQADSAAS